MSTLKRSIPAKAEAWFLTHGNTAVRGYVLAIALDVTQEVLHTTLGRMAKTGKVHRIEVFGEQAVLYCLTANHYNALMKEAKHGEAQTILDL